MRLALVAGVLAIGCGRPAPVDPYPTVSSASPATQRSFCQQGVFTDCNALAEKNPAQARALYTHTCEAGVAEGCFGLVQLVTGDANKLADLREQACDLGSSAACERFHIPPDFHRAIALYSKACDRGHPVACVIAGRRDAIAFDEETSNAAESRCATAADMLSRSDLKLPDLDEPVVPEGVALAQQRYNALAHRWWYTIAWFAERVGKLQTITPDLARCFEYIDEHRTMLTVYGDQIARARRGERPRPPLLVELAPYADSLRRLAALVITDANKRRRTVNVLAGLALEDTTRVTSDLAAIDHLCQERAPDAGKTFPTKFVNIGSYYVVGDVDVPSGVTDQVDAWCYVGANRVALLTEALTRMPFVEGRSRLHDELALAFLDPGALQASIVREAELWARALGVTVPANVQTGADELVRNLRRSAQFLRSTGVLRGRSPVRDPRVERLVAAQIARETGGVLRGVQLTEYREVPEEHVRWRTGTLVSRRPKLPFCEQRTFTYTEARVGGRWQSSRGIEIARGGYTPVSCE